MDPADLDGALRTQQRRLTRAVTDPDRPAFDCFLRALWASKVAPLIDVLDANGIALIRESLQPFDWPRTWPLSIQRLG